MTALKKIEAAEIETVSSSVFSGEGTELFITSMNPRGESMLHSGEATELFITSMTSKHSEQHEGDATGLYITSM